MIGIEAIVACIMSIDKDDPPRRGEGARLGAAELLALLLCKKVADVCCIEKKKASIFLSCSSKKLRFVY